MAKEKESFENKVREEVEKTGLPTEIRATEILRANDWFVYNEYPYLDVDENKVRTLDMVADKSFLKSKPATAGKKEKREIGFSCRLFIECKKSVKQSWVFFAETSPEPFIYFGIDRLAYDATYGALNLAVRLYSQSSKELKGKSLEKPISIFSRIPVRFETFKYKIALSQKPVFSEKHVFYDALMKVLKSLAHEEKQKADGQSLEFRPNDIVIPVIIFDGLMYECYYKKGQIRTPEIKFTRYLAHGLPNQRFPALVDVMTLDYFPTYLRLIERELTLKTGRKKVTAKAK